MRKTTAAVRGKKLTQDRCMEAILRYKDVRKSATALNCSSEQLKAKIAELGLWEMFEVEVPHFVVGMIPDEVIVETLRSEGNISAAAQELIIPRQVLKRTMKSRGITLKAARARDEGDSYE